MSTEEVGFVHIDENMDLDAIRISLVKDGESVDIWMASNPKPGRYQLRRGEREESQE